MDLLQDLPVLPFETPDAWRAWLEAHHREARGVWVRLGKKAATTPSITYAQALDEALCWGWIDSTKRSYDAESFLQRFSPRKPDSLWSQINCEHIARLTAEGRMQPPGLAAVELAKANGRWASAYGSQRETSVPPELEVLLAAHPEARAYFESMNRANRYAYCFRVQTLKTPEGRARKAQWALERLLRHEPLHD